MKAHDKLPQQYPHGATTTITCYILIYPEISNSPLWGQGLVPLLVKVSDPIINNFESKDIHSTLAVYIAAAVGTLSIPNYMCLHIQAAACCYIQLFTIMGKLS